MNLAINLSTTKWGSKSPIRWSKVFTKRRHNFPRAISSSLTTKLTVCPKTECGLQTLNCKNVPTCTTFQLLFSLSSTKWLTSTLCSCLPPQIQRKTKKLLCTCFCMITTSLCWSTGSKKIWLSSTKKMDLKFTSSFSDRSKGRKRKSLLLLSNRKRLKCL